MSMFRPRIYRHYKQCGTCRLVDLGSLVFDDRLKWAALDALAPEAFGRGAGGAANGAEGGGGARTEIRKLARASADCDHSNTTVVAAGVSPHTSTAGISDAVATEHIAKLSSQSETGTSGAGAAELATASDTGASVTNIGGWVRWALEYQPHGGIGNQLFQFVGALGIARARKAQLCGALPAKLAAIFIGPWAPLCPAGEFRQLRERGFATWDGEMVAASGEMVAVGPYLQSWRSFAGMDGQVLSLLRFQPHVTAAAHLFMATHQILNSTRIGVHIRRGDFDDRGQMPPPEWYKRVLGRLLLRWPGAALVVCSDEPEWVRGQDVFAGAVVSDGQQPGVDLAILARSQAVVTSRGTFGWWAAFLSRGTHVYFPQEFNLEHPINRGQVVVDDYYLPTAVSG
mmetsp:Transcript_39522/g.88727  ORF Transcript_39522/g.88727 Transcript_39522/m.88727 type:complete len:399 (-) Transcript_39522:13-1209(-)